MMVGCQKTFPEIHILQFWVISQELKRSSHFLTKICTGWVTNSSVKLAICIHDCIYLATMSNGHGHSGERKCQNFAFSHPFQKSYLAFSYKNDICLEWWNNISLKPSILVVATFLAAFTQLRIQRSRSHWRKEMSKLCIFSPIWEFITRGSVSVPLKLNVVVVEDKAFLSLCPVDLEMSRSHTVACNISHLLTTIQSKRLLPSCLQTLYSTFFLLLFFFVKCFVWLFRVMSSSGMWVIWVKLEQTNNQIQSPHGAGFSRRGCLNFKKSKIPPFSAPFLQLIST